MTTAANTPIIVGVGQFTDRIDSPDYQAMSSVAVAAKAAQIACDDALPLNGLRDAIDAIATTRTVEDSGFAPALFGRSNNYPRSIAKLLGINPRLALWESAGGQASQQLINLFCEKLAAGSVEVALLTGGEAISTIRHMMSQEKKLDWAETVDGTVEDHGWGLKGFKTRNHARHRLLGPVPGYALAENARRGRLGMTRDAYAREMGRLFAPFSKIAATNPYSSSATTAYSAEDLITPGERNRMIADPYTQRLIARDQVNQGAAVVLTTVGKAKQLGIPESKWVYLHGYCDLKEYELLRRPDIGASPAAQLASKAALEAAGISADDISYFDFYSCFPIAVLNAACDGLGLSPDDPRGLTVTGGLPFFGGPGNNYSMHAVATMVEKMRATPGTYGFIGANGGSLTKYSTGVYSTRPKEWKNCDSKALQAHIEGLPAPEVLEEADGTATVESYTVVYAKGQPSYALVVGRLDGTGARFLANNLDEDAPTLQEVLDSDPLGRKIYVRSFGTGNKFTFSEERMHELVPNTPAQFREKYEYCLVERRGHLLEVTINRPEVRNCLHPMANDELAEIFDAYEADRELWVAVIVGAGTEAFCSGNDLKYTASRKPMWVPKTGFGGLTNRQRTKPVIAAVNGVSMGGGTEIALACDMVVADEKAQFALSEVRVGLIAMGGGLVRLPRQIPKKIAVELILTGGRLDVQKAHHYGLVNRVVETGKALEGARQLAEEIMEGSPTSVRLSMQLINETEEFASEAAALKHRSSAVEDLICSEDMAEGPMAFAQKRKPSWKNR